MDSLSFPVKLELKIKLILKNWNGNIIDKKELTPISALLRHHITLRCLRYTFNYTIFHWYCCYIIWSDITLKRPNRPQPHCRYICYLQSSTNRPGNCLSGFNALPGQNRISEVPALWQKCTWTMNRIFNLVGCVIQYAGVVQKQHIPLCSVSCFITFFNLPFYSELTDLLVIIILHSSQSFQFDLFVPKLVPSPQILTFMLHDVF